MPNEVRNPRPRAPYVHPNGRWISVGFEDEPDRLLEVRGGELDALRVKQWCDAIGKLVKARA